MRSQDDVYYQAYLARDHRFDGKFFIGVKTTGIYCRPICPAKPKRENVEFFSDALSAEGKGYRPCLRCRPECAPLSPAWLGKSATVQRALRLIANSGLVDSDEDRFADQLGISARHLRRLFETELGKTPKQLSDVNRLNFARKLVVETQVSITEIAFTSGFSSIRRFNEAFKTRFHRPPSKLRKGKSSGQNSTVTLTLAYRPPFDWKSLLHFYETHLISGVESVTSTYYQRVFKTDGTTGALRLSHNEEDRELNLEIAASDSKSLHRIAQNIRQMFDLDSDPMLVSQSFSNSALLSKLQLKYPGLRLSRGWDPFETVVCSILGQLVSVEQARRLVKQLVENHGTQVLNPFDNTPAFLFPTPNQLATGLLSQVGTTQARKKAIREFSSLVDSKKLRLDPAQDPNAFRQALLRINGIGPWTAEYVSLRALGDTDAFPKTDLILKRAMENNPGLNVELFKPWRGYAAVYLWKEYAAELFKKGKIK